MQKLAVLVLVIFLPDMTEFRKTAARGGVVEDMRGSDERGR